jgi:hypothetical protein
LQARVPHEGLRLMHLISGYVQDTGNLPRLPWR